MANRPDGMNTFASETGLQYRLDVAFELLAH